MPNYDFECQDCFKVFEKFFHITDWENNPRNPILRCPECESPNVQKMISPVAILGSRDNFGIGREFKDPETGKIIDNWKSWEKAGYKNPLEITKNHDVKEKIKRKIDKIKRGL